MWQLLYSTIEHKSGNSSVGFCDLDWLIPCDLIIAFLVFQLYVSVEFGRRWQLVHDGVVPNRFYWWDQQSVICRQSMCLREKCCNTAILICSKNTMNNWQVQNNYTLINQNVCIFSILFARGAEEERWFLFILICHLKYHKFNFSWIGWWLLHWCTSDSHCSLSQHIILQIKAVLLRNVGFITVSVGGISNNLDI